jgi:hypothetical protein
MRPSNKIVKPHRHVTLAANEYQPGPAPLPEANTDLYAHQKEDFERYKDSNEVVLFWTMGCVDAETEYFNGTTWKRIADYTDGDKVLQWNSLTGAGELVTPTRYIKEPVDKMVWFKTARGMNQMLTLDHRIYSVGRGSRGFMPHGDMTVADLLDKSISAVGNYLCPIAFKGYEYDRSKWTLDEYETRLMIAVIADGHFARRTNWCRMNLKHSYKAERIEWLLNKCGLKYKTHHTLERDGYYRFYFYAPLRLKTFTDIWYDCPTEWVTSEVLKWDGDEGPDGYGQFNSIVKESADFVQFKFASEGKRTSIFIADRLAEGKGYLYSVIITEQRPYTTWYTSYTKQQPMEVEQDYKYCFTVPSSYLILRRGGGIFVTGNCGKSAEICRLAAYKYKHGKINAMLVVAPNTVHKQWAMQQIPLWLDCNYELQCLYGRGGQKKAYPFSNNLALQVVCVNVDTFSTPSKWKDIADWANSRRTFIVLDEATCIANISSARTQHILYGFNHVIRQGKRILQSVPHSAARAILTGTPAANGSADLWSLMEFVRPNFFGRNYYSFQNYFGMFTALMIKDGSGELRNIKVPLTNDTWAGIKSCSCYDEAQYTFGCTEDTYLTIQAQDKYLGPYKHADELKVQLDVVASYRKIEDCVDMPSKNFIPKTLIMSDEQRTCYDSMVNEYYTMYNDVATTALNKITVMIRLQQICSGFIWGAPMISNDFVAGEEMFVPSDNIDVLPKEVQWIGKTNPKLDALYRDVSESEKPVIILTRFTAEAARIYDDLSKNYRCCLMTGWKKEGTVEEFQEGKYDVMVANSTVVSHGFNLQNSAQIIFYSNTFSLETRLQAEGRIYRIGQARPCTYVDYLFEDSVDEKIVSALQLKRNLLDFIMGADIKELLS